MSQILIKNGTLIDGTGAPRRQADLLIDGERIAAIQEPGGSAPEGAEVVDASGMVVAPGFIDVMSHSVSSLLASGLSVGKVTQGVTTEIMGEGWTPAPAVPGEAHAFPVHGLPNDDERWIERAKGWTRFGDWMAAQEDVGASVNFGSFLGGTTVRMAARGHTAGESSPEQIAEMRRVTREAMEDGAYGVATALIYPPGSYASTDELIAVCEEVGRAQGIYITHMRSEGEAILEGFAEALEISERSGARLHLYHLKAAGRPAWPKMATLIERINGERAAGKDIHADMYLYTAGGTGLAASCPPWASEDDQLKERLRDPVTRAKIRAAMENPDSTWEPLGSLAGPEGAYPVGLKLPQHAGYKGKSLAEIATMRGQDWIDTALDLIESEPGGIGTLYHLMTEENIARQLGEPWVMIGSDAAGDDPGDQDGGHPRALGNFTRLLGHYVREKGLLSLEEGVRRMTSLPAEHLHLKDRGELREGAYADVVIFDPATIQDKATYAESNKRSVGVQGVWVNGVQTLKDGQHTGALPGMRLYGPGARTRAAQ
ncbi:amidohydrolase family protein [Deinococcus rubellus]|uniref:N-acyl-D-amino-acid deacylase family protein n=1 Tax=Deinococcus rubellus TaxID=1889240 RepID=UPI0031E5DBF2